MSQPKSARAVERACAANPVSLTICCHRVIRNHGELGGYRWGMNMRRKVRKAISRDTSRWID